jgi:hypothetical protein
MNKKIAIFCPAVAPCNDGRALPIEKYFQLLQYAIAQVAVGQGPGLFFLKITMAFMTSGSGRARWPADRNDL